MNILRIRFFIFLLGINFFWGCSISNQIQKDIEQDALEENFFKGIVVFNTKTKKDIVNVNGTKYFTPASNTKLFTFYVSWRSLQDSVAAFEYFDEVDSLIIKGVGDPGFLKDTSSTIPLDFLKNTGKNVYLVDENIDDVHYGMGWSWDDYPYYYMPEKSLFPIYGNTVNIRNLVDSLYVRPAFFSKNINLVDGKTAPRDLNDNNFYLKTSGTTEDREIPFNTSNQLVADLLGQELGTKVTLIPDNIRYLYKPVYRTKYDSLYAKMLVDSDNFIAEQLMLQVGKATVNSYNTSKAINYALENFLSDIPQEPRWVDGSGLSRYNLFTPSSMVYILNKLYQEIPGDKLFDYFPKGGESGTLKNNYENQSYIFAKSGTLSNNYNLSGYLITKKGTVLIFSYMNNHYLGSSTNRKREMKKYFTLLYENF